MERDIATAEPIPRLDPYQGGITDDSLRRSTRAKIFAVATMLTIAVGVAATLLQPSMYRASATVLMTAPVAIDDQLQEANVQSVAIQRRVLLGGEVTDRLLEALHEDGYKEITARTLRDALSVDPVPETNLAEMSARGEDSTLLPRLVDTWIDVYLDIRAAGIQASHQQTLRLVRDQLAGLEVKLEEARTALALYREEHNITSPERQENEVMARLEGLNTALNNAREAEVLTGARVQSMEKALAAGKQIVAASDRKSVAEMENELRKLQAQLRNLTKDYTLEYVRKQPKFRNIPVRIAELEQELEEAYAKGEDLELSLARQEHEAAQQTVLQLREQLSAVEEEASEFTNIYATHQALSEDLARLEDLNRETQSRLIEVQINPVDKYPQVSVIDRPGEESTRLGPNYPLWFGGTLAAALLLGVLSVWLYGFLIPRRTQPAFVTLSGVHMYPQEVSGNLAYTDAPVEKLEENPTALLSGEKGPGNDQGDTDKDDTGTQASDATDDSNKNKGD